MTRYWMCFDDIGIDFLLGRGPIYDTVLRIAQARQEVEVLQKLKLPLKFWTISSTKISGGKKLKCKTIKKI